MPRNPADVQTTAPARARTPTAPPARAPGSSRPDWSHRVVRRTRPKQRHTTAPPHRTATRHSTPGPKRAARHTKPPAPRREPPRPCAPRRSAPPPPVAKSGRGRVQPPRQQFAPRAALPSPQTATRRTPGRAVNRLDQLQQHHLGRIRPPRPQLQDPRVPAGPLRIPRCDLLEQLVDHELVLPERRQRLPARVQITALGQRDQLLELGLDRLGLRLGGPDPLVRDDLLGQVHQQRLAVRRVTRQLVSVSLVTHIERSRTLPANYSFRSPRPRACRVSITSSIDFLPKLGIAASSDSLFETRSPTVWMPARFRQL